MNYQKLGTIRNVKISELKPRHNLKWTKKRRKMGAYCPEKYDYITIDYDKNIMDGHHRLHLLKKRLGSKTKIKVRQLGIHYRTYAIFMVLVILSVVISIFLSIWA